MKNHGALGECYPPTAVQMEGDTPSFFGLINNGLGWNISLIMELGGRRYKLYQAYGRPDQSGQVIKIAAIPSNMMQGKLIHLTEQQSGVGAIIFNMILQPEWIGVLQIHTKRQTIIRLLF